MPGSIWFILHHLFFSFPSSSENISSSLNLSILSATYHIMSVFKYAPSCGPEFCKSPSFPVSRYVREYVSYLGVLRFTDMRAIDRALTVPDRHNVLRNFKVGESVKPWFHCAGPALSISRCVGFEDNCRFVRCTEDVEYEMDLSALVQHFNRQSLPKSEWLVAVLRRSCNHLNFADHFNYWSRNCNFELHLRGHSWWIFSGWDNIDLIALLLSQQPSYYFGTPGWLWDLEGYHLSCVWTSLVFAYYSRHTLKHHPFQDSVWRIVTSEFVVCPFIKFLALAGAGISVSASRNGHMLSVKERILVLLHLSLHGHIKQYNIFELVHFSGYDMNLDVLVYHRSWVGDWSRFMSSL